MRAPQILDLYNLRAPVTISPRAVLEVYDTANQSLAANASVNTLIHTAASLASTPPVGQVGRDLTLTANQLLLIESCVVQFAAMDNSGKLVAGSMGMYDADGNSLALLMPNTGVVPYTFQPIVQDSVNYTLLPIAPSDNLIDPGVFATFGQVLSLLFGGYLRNTDGAAAHTYQRYVTIEYRTISGVEPGPLVIHDLK